MTNQRRRDSHHPPQEVTVDRTVRPGADRGAAPPPRDRPASPPAGPGGPSAPPLRGAEARPQSPAVERTRVATTILDPAAPPAAAVEPAQVPAAAAAVDAAPQSGNATTTVPAGPPLEGPGQILWGRVLHMIVFVILELAWFVGSLMFLLRSDRGILAKLLFPVIVQVGLILYARGVMRRWDASKHA